MKVSFGPEPAEVQVGSSASLEMWCGTTTSILPVDTAVSARHSRPAGVGAVSQLRGERFMQLTDSTLFASLHGPVWGFYGSNMAERVPADDKL